MGKSVKFEIEGFEALEQQLKEISQSQGKAAVRKSLKKAAKPVADAARGTAAFHDKTGKLRKSIAVSTRLSRRQAALQRRAGRDDVMVFVGPGGAHGHLIEFGTKPHINKGKFAGTKNPGTRTRPFMRPAWEAHKDQSLKILIEELWKNIERRIELNARKK